MGAGGSPARLLLLLWGGCVFLGGGGAPFQLQDVLGGLRGDNARLEGTLRNLSRALGQLRARLRDPPDPPWTQEPPPELPPPCSRGAAPPPPSTAAAPPPTWGGLLLGGGAAWLLL